MVQIVRDLNVIVYFFWVSYKNLFLYTVYICLQAYMVRFSK